MARRTIAALLLLAGTAGCWTESCASDGVCTERIASVWDPEPTAFPGQGWCGEVPVAGKSCSDLGYTVECGGVWYRPEAAPWICR
jgi:hypothetical protein